MGDYGAELALLVLLCKRLQTLEFRQELQSLNTKPLIELSRLQGSRLLPNLNELIFVDHAPRSDFTPLLSAPNLTSPVGTGHYFPYTHMDCPKLNYVNLIYINLNNEAVLDFLASFPAIECFLLKWG